MTNDAPPLDESRLVQDHDGPPIYAELCGARATMDLLYEEWNDGYTLSVSIGYQEVDISITERQASKIMHVTNESTWGYSECEECPCETDDDN